MLHVASVRLFIRLTAKSFMHLLRAERLARKSEALSPGRVGSERKAYG